MYIYAYKVKSRISHLFYLYHHDRCSDMKRKSASVQNFEHLVKQIINGARPANDQLIGFHRMISENCCIKKLSKSRSTERKGSNTKELESNQQISSATDISATIAHRRSCRPKYKRSSSRQVQSINDKDEREHLNILQVQTYLSHSKEEAATVSEGHEDSEDHFNQLRNIRFAPATTPAANVIEIWSKSPKRMNRLPNPNIKDNDPGEDRTLDHILELSSQKQNEARLSFEAWKRKKTIAYQQIIKKIAIEQQQKLLKDTENLEWKKTVQQTRIRKKEQAENQRRKKLLSQKHLEMIGRTYTTFKSSCSKNVERQDFDQYVLKVSTNECKETTLDKKKKANVPMTRRSNNMPKVQRNKIHSTVDEPIENVTFYSWLNQLNLILHKKYLRERRYLVRSFYCQPFYYGDANFYAR